MKKRKINLSISAEERALFRNNMADVNPLVNDKVHHALIRNKTTPPINQSNMDKTMFVASPWTESIPHDDTLLYVNGGITLKRQRQLRQGKIEVQRRLDLHGQTLNQSAASLSRFLDNCTEANINSVLIIHGKGYNSGTSGPVLKTHINHWLKSHPAVLAFSSAQPCDGGTGAVYVLLRQANKIFT